MFILHCFWFSFWNEEGLCELDCHYHCWPLLHLAWARSVNDDDEDLELGAIPAPPSAHVAQQPSRPAPKHKQKAEPGRLWDHLRTAEPYIQRRPFSEDAPMWREYIKSTRNPIISDDLPSVRVTHEWLDQNGPDYSQPWLAGRGNENAENDAAHLFKHHKHKKTRWQRMQRIILRNAIVPLAIRAIVLFFSIVAMCIGVSLWRETKLPTSSMMMATVVDGFALFYLIGITYDEYTGKPLGLRSATAKMRLIFLDLLFIVCDSANLCLALEAVAHLEPGCVECDPHWLKALAAVLLIALVSWILTFAISVLRYVHFIPSVSEKDGDEQNWCQYRVIERVSG